MSYGQSAHYKHDAGRAYFAYQNELGALAGRLLAFTFQQHISKDDRVLDFGCGGGWLLRALDCGEKIGVEPNLHARAQCEANGVQAVSELSEVSGHVDVVVSNHCLEHVPYPIEALRLIRSKLESDGKCVLVVPIDDWRTQKTYDPADIDHHLHTWTPRLLGNTMNEAGFKNIRIKILTHAWPPKVEFLARWLPHAVFDGLCWSFAVLRRRRQLMAIATR